MIDGSEILITGGDGCLGTELRSQDGLADMTAPSETEMDITDPQAIRAVFDSRTGRVVLHAAAYTDVAGAEANRKTCWTVNVEGTVNIVREVMRRGLFLVHISTDYVFEGTSGMYREGDPLGPVRNYYSLTKLAGESVVRLCPNHLVIRTSFRPRQWPHPAAFTDVFTGQDYIDIIAPEIALAIRRCDEIPYDTLHIVTERKSAYELAKRRRGDVRAGSKAEAGVDLPDDISLDTSRWRGLKKEWS